MSQLQDCMRDMRHAVSTNTLKMGDLMIKLDILNKNMSELNSEVKAMRFTFEHFEKFCRKTMWENPGGKK